MAGIDPNLEWLGLLQPTGLVVAPTVLARYGLLPEQQTRADSSEAAELLAPPGQQGPALPQPWPFFAAILGWNEQDVAGAPGGPPMPEELVVDLADTATTLAPSWAVADPDGGWQLLVRIEALGVDPDERGALAGWEATAHQRFERLLRETGVPTGLLLTDGELRLIHAPRGETSGWLAFPLRALASVGGRPMLGGLKLLLSAFRLHNDATERRLPSLLRASRAAQAEVSAKLATQVLGALHELLRGLHAADRARVERLAKQRPAHLYEGLLAVLLRLVFLLYAEDRALIPSRADGAARALYDEGYGVRSLHARLLADRARNPDTMDERRGAWGRLLALFRLVHAGDGSKWIRARGGKLFNPAEFPFLQGQDDSRDPADPAPVTDGCVLGVLDGLLTLDGERLSYRTLDVEQIGSVYETVMGFTVLTLTGPALALKVKPNSKSKHYTPVFVDLNALLATSGKERQKHLREAVGVKDANEKRGTALVSAVTIDDLARVLLPLVDERGSPGGAIAAPGTPLLQPTDERRRTGSHYTPRDLTEPIVRHALEPAFERIGDAATPEAVLALKVCDPAMGSGAFLVEACRQLAARLMQAWARHAGTRPPIPLDEDEDLLARRLVAQRCLYGVDRNPMATDLARLSLWLATLARDHEFTFLDHALKTGDSLVGLGRKQITWLHWQGEKGLPLFEITLKERIPKAIRLRSAIRHAPDDVALDDQIHAFREVEKETRELREVGDAILGAFFSHAKSKEREKALREVQEASGNADRMWEHLRPLAATLRQGEHPIRPFHWEIEFPEVFDGDAPGFDAIVGNPPFAGKNTLIGGHRAHYLDWLQTLHEGAHGNADLVAHFFRRAFALLRPGGCFGLIATNTIGQGDTRESGLRALLEAGGSILRAVRRTKWPGEAAVVVSLVHVRKGSARSPVLDGRQVRRISAYLVEGDLDASPGSLTANAGKAFIGCFLLGLGFTFDDAAAAKGKASPVSEMHRLIAKDNRNAERIFPYLGGEEVNTDPRHAHHRWVIDFNNFPLRRQEMVKAWAAMDEHERAACRRTGLVPLDYPDPVAADWPDLLEIVERLVKPERATNTDRSRREIWWQFTRRTPGLRQAIFGLKQVIVTNVGAAPHLAFAFLPADRVYAHTLGVVASEDTGDFGVCQSRTHETWARSFSSTLEDRLRYTPSDSLVSFPMPVSDETKDTAETYHDHRAALMIARNEGLTRTYNRFHDPAERASDIVRLRELHHAMDQAVLRAYGWDDLAEAAAPEFLTEDTEHDHRYQNRLFWPAPFRDEVLARLLALNAQRAAEERALGMAPARGDDEMALEEVE